MSQPSGGGGGGGGGYNIPVSLSDATSQAFANQFQAGTTFNFQSPYSGTNYAEQAANPVLPSTAVSAAGQEDATSTVPGSGVVAVPSPVAASVNWKMIGLVAAGVAAIGITLYILKKQ